MKSCHEKGVSHETMDAVAECDVDVIADGREEAEYFGDGER
jgi:hypothetical protein